MEFEQYRQSIIDEERLHLLPVFYWVSGGVTVLVSLYFLIYMALGVAFVALPTFGGDSSSSAVGWIFFAVGTCGFLLIAAFATLKILVGFWIRKRKHRIACLVVAGISCIEIPWGTFLGVYSFSTLQRPAVMALFDAAASTRAGYPPLPPGAYAQQAPATAAEDEA
ncbi:MAG: hypothetical protein P4L93_06630 [Coriobacteriia bacterium]|nr:hypothetical protein [Coriobacteriia bacterium]